MRALELLAPAKNLAYGIAAIDHGADAVYIGAEHFGARVAAGNPVSDISQLCQYAHIFGAKVYVTVNTIVYDEELESTRQLLAQLEEAGVDAILVQDMALLKMSHALPMHASTQTDNRTPEKVRWLRSLGFRRVVLARELSVDEIAQIHAAVPDVELEVFVHGALCVSYSGLCYASQYCFERSANRGACAQFCRMKFSLVDADGRVIERDRHLLSLKDMNQSDHLDELIVAGATSFKIEGRLKDLNYVKNVTAAYSERLNAFIRRHPTYCRASRGHVTYTFQPDLQKTFNRGYTTYFLKGRQPSIASFDTPKAMGEYVGQVKELRHDSLTVAGISSFANGDGLCFLNAARELEGFRVNRVEGNRLYPHTMPQSLHPGVRLYRNNDQEFERILSRPSAVRKIPITLSLRPTADGFALSSGSVTVTMSMAHQEAQKPQQENIIRQLTKLGNTPYECSTVEMPQDFNFFIPSSQLSELRRLLCDKLREQGKTLLPAQSSSADEPNVESSCPSYPQSHCYNIANQLARQFYDQQGVKNGGVAYELQQQPDAMIMKCRHCLRYSLGYCVKHAGSRSQWREPLSLLLGDGRRFRLEFDCQRCQMNVYAQNHP